MIYIGIDPGKNGCIALIDSKRVDTISLKDPISDDVIDYLLGIGNSYKVLLEKVHSMPRQGVTSMFSFGMNYGMIQGVLAGLGIEYDLVTPQTWQSRLGLSRKGVKESTTQKKNRHKDLAKSLYPWYNITHGNADGILIAEYCRRVSED